MTNAVDQSQKAGDNSHQYAIGSVEINNGMSIEEVEKLFDEKADAIMRQNITVANDIVDRRLKEFNKKSIDRLAEEDALNAFVDPSSLEFLVNAQRKAAVSNRNFDQDILAELLVYRFRRKNDHKIDTAIYKAIENVNLVDDDSLLGLTVLYAIHDFQPISGDLGESLKIMDDLFAKLLYDKLPYDNDWLEQLEILGMVKTSKISRLKKLENYWYEKFDGALRLGIKKDSSIHNEAKKILQNAKINENSLIENKTYPEFVKLQVINRHEIENANMLEPGGKVRKINDSEIDVFRQVYDLCSDKISLKEFVQKITSYESINKVRNWWNKLATDQSIEVTPIGRVLANTNAQRIDKGLPGLK